MSQDKPIEVEAAARTGAADRIRARLGRPKKTAKEAVAEKAQAEAQREEAPAPAAPTFKGPPPSGPLPAGELKPLAPATAETLPMSRTVTPPAKWAKGPPLLFLDGGLGKAENWQAQVFDAVKRMGLQVLNPRRWEDARLRLRAEIQEQIRWEQEAAGESDYFVFWFTTGWVYPVAMYRLGQAMARRKRVFIGAHPDSPILGDLEAQAEHYGLKVYQNLNVLCQDLIAELNRPGAKKD